MMEAFQSAAERSRARLWADNHTLSDGGVFQSGWATSRCQPLNLALTFPQKHIGPTDWIRPDRSRSSSSLHTLPHIQSVRKHVGGTICLCRENKSTFLSQGVKCHLTDRFLFWWDGFASIHRHGGSLNHLKGLNLPLPSRQLQLLLEGGN